MLRQRRALGFAPRLGRFGLVLIDMPAHDTLGMSLLSFEILEREFQLIGKLRHALGRLAELHAAQLGKLGFELLDLECGQLDRVACSTELVAGSVMGLAFLRQRLFRGSQTRLHHLCESAKFIRIGRQIKVGGRHEQRIT